jgi:hypothetical protein
MEIKLDKKKIIYLILAISVIIAVWPWFSQGIPQTDDFRSHVAHLWHMQHSLYERSHPVFWMQELYSGWPIFEFNSVFSYFISIPFLLFFETVTALKLSIILSFIIAAISMFVASKILFKDDEIALVSSVAYTFSYYHFVNAGIRGAFHETWAYAIFPLAIALFISAFESPTRKNIFFATMISGIMLITHVPSSYMLGLVCILYVIYSIIKNKKIAKKSIGFVLFLGISAILLCSFWIVPFVTESGKANFGNTYTDFGKSLIGLDAKEGLSFAQLFERNYSIPGYLPDGKRSFYIGYSLLILALISFLYKNQISRFFAYLSLLTILIMLSAFLTNLVPLISLLQFSTRLMLVAAFSLSIVAGTSAKALTKFARKKQHELVLISIIVAIILIDFAPGNKFHWISQPNENFINNPSQIDVLKQISAEPGYFMVFTPSAQMAYAYHKKFEMGFDWEGFREGAIKDVHDTYTKDAFSFIDSLNKGDINNTLETSERLGYYGVKYIVLPCIKGLDRIYEIKYTNNAFCAYKNPHFSELAVIDKGTINNTLFNMDEITFSSNSDGDSKITLKVSDLEEHWHAYVDGKETKINDVFPKFMQIGVEKGFHKIEFKYKSTKTQTITRFISFFTLLILIAYYFELDTKWLKKKSKEKPKKKSQ